MSEERDYEAEAKTQGWRPEAEFKGDPSRWTDAKTFVEKGEKLVPILQSRVDRQQAEIDQLKAANKEFGEYTKKQREKDKMENARLINELQADLAAAVTSGDGETYTRANAQIKELEAQNFDAPAAQNNGLTPAATAWLEANQWYNTDQRLQVYADGISDRIRIEGFVDGTPGYFNELTSRVKAAFPESFPSAKGGNNSVESGGTIDTPSSKSKRTFDNLPPEAKKACNDFVKGGLMSKEDYVSAYEWDE